MRYKCPRCSTAEDIEWHIKGHNLASAVIRWKCYGCKLPMFLEIIFPAKKGQKPKCKILADDTNYIG